MKTFMNAMAGVVAGTLVVFYMASIACAFEKAQEDLRLFNAKLDRIDSRTHQTERFIANLERVEETEG